MVFLITRLELNALELTLVGTVLEVTVTLCEIPTGVVADTVSRKVSVVIGVALLGFGFLLYAVPSYPVMLLAQVVWAVGYTFTSGADVAWITDEVGEEAARPLYVARRAGRQAAIFAGIVVGAALGAIALVARHRRRRGAATRQRRVAVVPHARDGVRARRSRLAHERGDDHEADRDRRGRHRPHPPDAARDARRHGAHRARLGRLRPPVDTCTSSTTSACPEVGNLAPVVWIGALEARGLLCAVGLTEIVRRRADLDSDRGVERTAKAVVVGMIVAVVAFGLSRSFWFATIALCARGRGVGGERARARGVGQPRSRPRTARDRQLARQPSARRRRGRGRPDVRHDRRADVDTDGARVRAVSCRCLPSCCSPAGAGPRCASPVRCPPMLLLLSAARLRRVRDRIGAAVPHVQFVRMQDDGDLVIGDRTITWEDAEPDVAWLTADLFDGGPVRKFFRLALEHRNRSGCRAPAPAPIIRCSRCCSTAARG